MNKDAIETISAEEFATALAIQSRIEQVAERRLPLYVNLRRGKPSRNAEYASYRSFDETGAQLLYDDTYDEREWFELPLAVLLEPDFEQRAHAEITARDAAEAVRVAEKTAAENAAREAADRETYERLRARFETDMTERIPAS